MKTVVSKLGLFARLSATTAALLLSQQALAVGTDAGTAVSNTATVSYDVNSTAQTPVDSNAADFVVDRLVTFTVTEIGGALTTTSVGDTQQFIDFFITNTSNSDLDFNLIATQLTSGDGEIFVGSGLIDTDIDMNNVSIAVAAAIDTTPGTGDGPDPVFGGPSVVDNLPEDQSIRVRIYADTPAVAADGSIAGFSLDATAADPATGTDLVETPGVDDPALVENVFGDAGNDGVESARDGYLIQSAALTITKAAAVISDPLGSGKALPGAIVEYTITIDNSTGSQSADDVSISDPIDTDVTFVTDAYNGNASNVSISDGVTTTFCLADAADANGDGCTFDGTTLTIAGSDDSAPVTVVPLNVAAGATVTVSFQVEIPAL